MCQHADLGQIISQLGTNRRAGKDRVEDMKHAQMPKEIGVLWPRAYHQQLRYDALQQLPVQ